MTNFALARENMVESQVRTNDVTSLQLQAALRSTPRERFVPKSARALAYAEKDIEIAPGRTLCEVRDFAKLVHCLDIEEGDLILDIGCGTGYSSAILAALGAAVVAVESDEDLADAAAATLSELDVDNAAVVKGPLSEGRADQGPYDVIFINNAVETLPDALFAQLKEGGRLGAICLEGGVGKARIFTKSGEAAGGRVEFDAMAPVLPGFEVKKEFTF